MKTRKFFCSAGILAFLSGLDASAGDTRRFEPLPPVWKLVDENVPSPPSESEHDPIRFGVRALLTRRADNALAIRGKTLARDINSLDEVPDSSWFENRIGRKPLTAEDVFWGPVPRGTQAPGSAENPLIVTASKEEGANPGFIAKDSQGNTYLVKFDPPHRPEMQTAADLVGSRLFWALGYHVPQDFVTSFRREDLKIDPESKIEDDDDLDQDGDDDEERVIMDQDIDRVLERVARNEDGSYRCQLSLFVPGKVLGPIAQEGVRKGDPNDRIPHEDRRSMRAVKVFAAWLNHVDINPGNTLDSYVTENESSFVRHYFIDFGEIFASSAGESGNMRGGFEYRFDPSAILTSLLTLGLHVHQWEHVKESGFRGIGPFGATPFRYEDWKPALPNRYMKRITEQDELWAVQKMLSLTDEHLDAAVRSGLYTDPASAAYLLDVLKQRREEIALHVLGNVNPATSFKVQDDGRTLAFQDLAIQHGLADATGTAWRVQRVARGAQGDRVEAAFETGKPTIEIGNTDLQKGEQLVVRIQTLRSGRPLGDPVLVHLDTPQSQTSLQIVGVDRWRTGGFQN